MIWNRGILNQHNTHQKSCHTFVFLSPNRYEFELSYEVLMYLQKYLSSKLEVKGKSAGSAGSQRIGVESCQVGNFLDLKYFYSLFLTCKNAKNLIWKIWLIYVWRQKHKGVAWLLLSPMLAQSTPISYHTKSLVKTKVMSTVYFFKKTLAQCCCFLHWQNCDGTLHVLIAKNPLILSFRKTVKKMLKLTPICKVKFVNMRQKLSN